MSEGWSDYYRVLCRPSETTPTGRQKRYRKPGPIVAWDLETSRIPTSEADRMNVDLKYLTAFGAEGLIISERLDDDASLAAYFETQLFTVKRKRTRYCAWNGLRFDLLLLFRAIVNHAPQYAIRPYVAGQGAIRGAKVYLVENPKIWWELLDGMAMTYLKIRLGKFVEMFAPEFPKLQSPDWDTESFDAANDTHRRYAERDSEGLYHALCGVDTILVDLTGRGLQCTIGNAGIKFFERSLPENAAVAPVPDPLWTGLFAYALRGGYVFAKRQYDGPVWQYDINQAYAAAMKTPLPNGRAIKTRRELPGLLGIYWCRIKRDTRSPIPFYCKTEDGPTECYGEETHTLITSTEIAVLRRWGWDVRVSGGWAWRDAFDMSAMVDQLEHLRQAAPGGPSGPFGTMVKAIGNHSYGKTTERMSREQITIAAECPEEHFPWRPEDPALRGFWVKVGEDDPRSRKRYHRPQIGAFITAHVRMVLYDAIMQAPAGFLKADTDSIAFDRPVTHLDVHPSRYGAWKEEYTGNRGIVIGKKCYLIVEPDRRVTAGIADVERRKADRGRPPHAVCKGLNIRRLTLRDYEIWLASGEPPEQMMIQTLGWKHALDGDRYRVQYRHGANFRRTAPHLFERFAE